MVRQREDRVAMATGALVASGWLHPCGVLKKGPRVIADVDVVAGATAATDVDR